MKKLFIIVYNALFLVFLCNAQSFEDFPDQYNEDLTEKTFPNYSYEPPDGEYQLVVGQFPWGWDDYQSQYPNDWGPFRLYPKSVKIELVSFPFVPECLPNCYQELNVDHYRDFLTIPLDENDFIPLSVISHTLPDKSRPKLKCILEPHRVSSPQMHHVVD